MADLGPGPEHSPASRIYGGGDGAARPGSQVPVEVSSEEEEEEQQEATCRQGEPSTSGWDSATDADDSESEEEEVPARSPGSSATPCATRVV